MDQWPVVCSLAWLEGAAGEPRWTLVNLGWHNLLGYEFRDHMDANPNIEAFGDGWLRSLWILFVV